jgi:hypothetical protein
MLTKHLTMTTEQEYIGGFNHGYLLAKYEPELISAIMNGLRNGIASDYIVGSVFFLMFAGARCS